MKTALIAFGILVALAIAFVVLAHILAMRAFRRWPPEVWRGKLVAHLAQIHTRIQELEVALKTTYDGFGVRYGQAREKYVSGVSLNGLMQFPGIGPGTVLKLNEAGYSTAEDLEERNLEAIPGIGRAKAYEIMNAYRSLISLSMTIFEQGLCPEGLAFQRSLDSFPVVDQNRIVDMLQEYDANKQVTFQCDKLFLIIEKTTFLSYARNEPIFGLSDEIMARPLPVPTWTKADQKPKPTIVPIPPEPPPVRRPATATATAKAPSAAYGDLFHAALKSGAAPVVTPPAIAQVSELKLLAVTRFAYLVAKCDGRVAKVERTQIRTLLMSLFGHDAVMARAVDPLMETTEKLNPKEASVLAEVKRFTTRTEQKTLLAFVDAMATGSPSGKKSQLRTRIGTDFGEAVVETQKPEPVPAPTAKPAIDHRAVLEIEPGIALDANLIRRRFAMLTEKLDVTKAAAMGLEFAKMAEAKRTTIRAAAESLMAPFGEPLDKPAPEPPKDLRHNPDLDDVFG